MTERKNRALTSLQAGSDMVTVAATRKESRRRRRSGGHLMSARVSSAVRHRRRSTTICPIPSYLLLVWCWIGLLLLAQQQHLSPIPLVDAAKQLDVELYLSTTINTDQGSSTTSTDEPFYGTYGLFGDSSVTISDGVLFLPPLDNPLLCNMTTTTTAVPNDDDALIILLTPRGECTFEHKAWVAQYMYQASAILIYNTLESRYGWNESISSTTSTTEGVVVWPEERFDYDCTDLGGGSYDFVTFGEEDDEGSDSGGLDPPRYSTERHDAYVTFASSNNTCLLPKPDECPSRRCLLAGRNTESDEESSSSHFVGCCAWDVPVTMNTAGPDADGLVDVEEEVSIPSVFVTMALGDVLLQQTRGRLGSDSSFTSSSSSSSSLVVLLTLKPRWYPRYNPSSFLLVFFATVLTWFASWFSAQDYRAARYKLTHPVRSLPRRNNHTNNNNQDERREDGGEHVSNHSNIPQPAPTVPATEVELPPIRSQEPIPREANQGLPPVMPDSSHPPSNVPVPARSPLADGTIRTVTSTTQRTSATVDSSASMTTGATARTVRSASSLTSIQEVDANYETEEATRGSLDRSGGINNNNEIGTSSHPGVHHETEPNRRPRRRPRWLRLRRQFGHNPTTQATPTAGTTTSVGGRLTPAFELTLWHAVLFVVVASVLLLLLFYFEFYAAVTVLYGIGCSSAVSQLLIRPMVLWIFDTPKSCRRRHNSDDEQETAGGACYWGKCQSTRMCPASWSKLCCCFYYLAPNLRLIDVASSGIGYTWGGLWLYVGFTSQDPLSNAFYWLSQNLFGACLCILFLTLLRLNSIQVATVLLFAVFIYDIFFVFITPYLFDGDSVMVTVARGGGPSNRVTEEYCTFQYPSDPECRRANQVLPMLLTIPKMMDFRGGHVMLGLGDIVLPGLLLSFCSRLDDAKRLIGNHTTLPVVGGIIPSRWYHGYLPLLTLAYGIGLFFASLAVVWMERGQPALLYIVPAIAVPLLIKAYRNEGELSDLWQGPKVISPWGDRLVRYCRRHTFVAFRPGQEEDDLATVAESDDESLSDDEEEEGREVRQIQ